MFFSGGKIAGFDVSGSQLKQGSEFYLDGTVDGTYFISSSKFQVTPSGAITGSNVLFTGGDIGGWSINASTISKNNVKLDSTTNAEGFYVKKTGFSDNTAGGFLGLDSGTAKFNVGNASKFIKFDGNHLTVDAGNFSLDSSGNMTATSAALTGTVTATAGAIGGFNITSTYVRDTANTVELSSVCLLYTSPSPRDS